MKYIFAFTIFFLTSQAQASDKIIRIYQDADLSNHVESSTAIQKGIEVAFDEINNEIDGYKLEFKYLDHRGNVVRSKQNYQKFLNDDKALAIYSGIHSPPLITNREFINKNKALTLVPWAAGGPITRYPSPENWVFRLSVDDTHAGGVIIDSAINDKQCQSPHLLLEGTPWGDSNLKSMSAALINHGIKNPNVTRFGWNSSEQSARIMVRKIINAESDCIILVANAVEGAFITQAVINLPENQRIPIISHWGITGGDFHEKITKDKRDKIDLTFIQSCFAFTNSQQNEISGTVFNRLKQLHPNIQSPNDLKSAVGFIHAYDITKLLIQAIQQNGLSGDIEKDRNNIRIALENLKQPVQGLIKTYDKPYSVFDTDNNKDAHEALGVDDYCMAQYGDSDEILITEPKI